MNGTETMINPDGSIRCEECGRRAVYIGYDDFFKTEQYRCREGHISELPAVGE